MYRRASVDINKLINRFEPVDDDSRLSENVKYVKVTRPGRKMHLFDDEELYNNTLGDENRLARYDERQMYTKRRSNVTMSSAKELTKQTITTLLCRLSGFLELISKFPFPRMSVMSFGLTSLLTVFFSPRNFTERALYPGFRILFAIIFPAYRSFKAVRNKNLKEYLKWIIYWIVFSVFTCVELVFDSMFSWFPFYYELKMVFFIWLLGPSTRGATKIYKTCIHPTLMSYEQEIDDIIQIAENHGYMHIFRLGSKSVNYANKMIMQQSKIDNNRHHVSAHQLARNVSLSSLSDIEIESHDGGDHFKTNKQISYDASSGYSSPRVERNQQISFFKPLNLQEEPVNSVEEYLLGMMKNSTLSQITSGKSQQQKGSTSTSEDEKITAYNINHSNSKGFTAENINQDKIEVPYDMHSDFLKWLEMKKTIKPELVLVDQQFLTTETIEKVKNLEAAENLQENLQESYRTIDEDNIKEPTSDYDEFKDTISDKEDEEELEYLKVPLVIHEDNPSKQNGASLMCKKGEKTFDEISINIESNVLTNDGDKQSSEKNMIEAKITLSNAPLEVVTSLSSSNVSLASSNDSSEVKKHRATKHSKGRAPEPPGQFYDPVTKKHFKETEL